MRILQVRSAFEDSGPGTQSLTIGRELRRRGHEVLYASSGGVMADAIVKDGFEHFLIPTLAVPKRDLVSTAKNIFRLGQIIRSKKVEVIHAHNAAAAYCAYFGSRIFGRLIPIFHSVRGLECRSTHQWRNWIYKVYPPKMFAVCEYTKRELVKLGVDPERVRVTYNGVDLARFDPTRVTGEKIRREFSLRDSLVVGQIGAFSGWKGQPVLVQAAARLLPEFPNLKIVFVGDGPARKPTELIAEKLGIRSAIIFAGQRFDSQDFLAAFDVFALPSEQGEMFPNAIVEAMAMAKPWVGSDISGLSELTARGEAGLISAPSDVEGLVKNLRLLLSNPELRARMGARGRREVEQRFTVDHVVGAIEEEYRMAV